MAPPASLTKIPELVEVFQEKVTTDLSLRNLLWLGPGAFAVPAPGDGYGGAPGVSEHH